MLLKFQSLELANLGEINIKSQATQYFPEELAEKKMVTLEVEVNCFQQSWQDNYDLMEQMRAAFNTQHGRLLWINDDDDIDQTILDRDVTVVSHNLPETSSSGTYQQKISIIFRYESVGLDDGVLMTATFKKTGDVGSPITLGKVREFKDSYSAARFSEMRNLRERSGGKAVLAGEFNVDSVVSIGDRRIQLAAKKAEMDAAVNGNDGTLTYGAPSFFNRIVRVEAWDCEVNQAVTSVKWSMTVGYTIFPNESGYATADFHVSTATSKETGDVLMSLTGKIASNSESNALAKLSTLTAAVLTAEGFTSTGETERTITRQNIDADSGATFLEITFSISYRKRASDVESYTLTVAEDDSTSSGLITTTISGSVTAGGATANAAFATAATLARTLGDNKYPYRMSGRITRQDRKVGVNGQEFVRVEFSFEYKRKGSRIYLEATSDRSVETFGETNDRVSGFVVASSRANAEAAYTSIIRNSYTGLTVRSESLSEADHYIGKGTYGADGTWTASSGNESMFIRLDFSFSVFRAKPDGVYACKYTLEVNQDFMTLTTEKSVQGAFYASQAIHSAIMAGTAGNKLEVLLASLGLGTLLKLKKESEYEAVGSDAAQSLRVGFSASYQSAMTSTTQILQCELQEQIKFTGTRWVIKGVPDGVSVIQDAGIMDGMRTVSGTVLAATETAAMAYVKKAHALPFTISGVGGGPEPAVRYEQPVEITKSFESVPLTELEAKGAGANFKAVRVNFTFAEILVNYPYSES